MRWLVCASALAILSGCHPYTIDIDGRIAHRAAQPIDVKSAPPAMPPEEIKEPKKVASFGPPIVQSGLGPISPAITGIVPVAAQKEPDKDKKAPTILDRLEFKESVLGLKIPDIQMWRRDATEKEKDEAIKKHFSQPPTIKPLPDAQPGPDGKPVTLNELQQIALRTNPKIRQAHLDIESARGLALQAGLYPNPSISYEGSSIGQGNNDGQRSPGQQGGAIQQQIVTMGKRTIAREAALRDVQIMEQNLKQAESDVQSQVRTGYFAVLSARENYRVHKGLAELTDELYNVLLLQMRAGEVAAYEPMQIRVLAVQARQALTLAQNRYTSAWRQLAANLGTPQMPLTALEGRIDMPVPHFEHDKLLAFVLANHTDIVSSQLGVDKNRFLVRLAEVQAFPDLTLQTGFQKDYTTPPFGSIANVSVSLPFPLWDRNQGNIQSTRALLRKALEDNLRVRNDLTTRTADAFERYTNNRDLLKMYKEHILPNQVQAFRAALARHTVDKSVSYNDVVTSQQTLATMIGSYLTALNDQWTSVIDIANLLQSKDLFQQQPYDEVTPIPDVYEIYRHGLRHRH